MQRPVHTPCRVAEVRGQRSGPAGPERGQGSGLPALAEVTGEGPLVTVAELDVDLQGGKRGAGHVTQRTLDVVHCRAIQSTTMGQSQRHSITLYW